MSMEMLFVTVGGALAGTLIHYLLPHRDLRGPALLAAVGTVAAAVSWAALTWLRLPFNGGWIWVISILAFVVVPVVVGMLLNHRRTVADDRRLTTLAKA